MLLQVKVVYVQAGWGESPLNTCAQGKSLMFKATIGAVALAVTLMMSSQAKAEQAGLPTRVDFQVICDEPDVAAKFRADIGDAIKANAGYLVKEQGPDAKLILYVYRDVNDKINPRGMSIAIVHVNKVLSYFLAFKYLVQEPTKDETVRAALTQMIHADGYLNYMNVAHIDESSDREIKIVSDAAVSTFFSKVKPYATPK